MIFDAENLARGMIRQSVWILIIICIVVGVIGYCTQGVGSALLKIAGALAVIFLLIALTNGQKIGEWLVEQLFTFGLIMPKNNWLGVITHGIQLYTRI